MIIINKINLRESLFYQNEVNRKSQEHNEHFEDSNNKRI